MIQFYCICKHPFSVAEDLAGGEIQCPQCGRLMDVPRLGEVKNLTEEGIYKVGAVHHLDEPGRLSELHRIYAKTKQDSLGRDIDLRPTLQDIAKAGVSEYEQLTPPRRVAPRYDPATGELIREIDLDGEGSAAGSAPAAAIPMATAVVNYDGTFQNREVNLVRSAVAVMNPVNIVVMAFILLAHIFFAGTLFPASFGFFLTLPFSLLLLISIIAHYANVIEDIGPNDQDELPRILRWTSLRDDVTAPLIKIFEAAVICYGPAALSLIFLHPKPMQAAETAAMLGIIGTILMPATLLTTITGGSIINLRPDRILGVMYTIGGRYLVAIVLFGVAMAFYVVGVVGTSQQMLGSRFALISTPVPLNGPVSMFVYGILVAGIYFMHLFCWYMGRLYRAYHDQFPWLYQRHIREPRPH